MGGFAWVTLATNDSYSLGALVLAHSIKQAGSHHQLVVLVTPGVTNSMREKLSSVFNLIQEVNILDSKDETNLRLLKRPELGVTFTKLHCWRLTQFDKCVFLDADTLVLKNCDELFEREELSAAPDVGWPDCFNSGVFVYRPSTETYEKLVQFALEKGSFDGGDQGLLNLYFSDWATKDISKHLPFIYNLCSTACYSYLPAFKQFGTDTKIIHFIGSAKPWLQYFNTETRKVQPSPDFRHLEGILQHWWNIFCSLVHSQLTSTMSGLAGAFAKLTLGAPRTAEQTALDDHLRRQGWEVGNIDYMGRDSFDNIWSKICQTIAPEVPPPSKTTEATTPSSTSEPQAEKSVPQEALPSPAVAAPQDSTSQTSEIIKLQSEPTQSIPSQQSKPVSEIESPVQASPEAPKEIKPEAPIVSEIVPTTEIPAVPAAQAEPLLCSLPSKLPQESVPVESPQAPIASKTEVASEKPSEIPPVVPTATPELPLAAAPPTGSSTSTKDVVATTPTDVVPAPSAPVASTIAESPAPEQICVIPSKGSETSAPAPQAESAPETPQTSPPPAEGTKSTPAQIQSLPEVPPPAEVQKPCERTSVEILLPEPTVIEPIPVKDIEKPIEVAPVVSAPKVESPSAPPSQEIPKTSTPDPVPSPLPTQQPTPVQGVAKVPEPAPTKVVPEPVPVPATTEAAAATPEESAPVKEAAPAAAVACTKEEASAAAPEAAAAEACKAKPAAKPKAESAGAGAQPTPPPRKTGGGGGKKSKSKK